MAPNFNPPQQLDEEDKIKASLGELCQPVKCGNYPSAAANCSAQIGLLSLLVRNLSSGAFFIRPEAAIEFGLDRATAVLSTLEQAEAILLAGSHPTQFSGEEQFRPMALSLVEEALATWNRDNLD